MNPSQIDQLPCTAPGENPSLELFKNRYIGICTNPAFLKMPIWAAACTAPNGLLFYGARKWADKCDIKPTVSTAGPAPASASLPASMPTANDPCQTTLKQQRDAWLQWCGDPFVVLTKDPAYRTNCANWQKGYEDYLNTCEPKPFQNVKCDDLGKFKDAYAALCFDPAKLRYANPLVKVSCRQPDGQYFRGSKTYMEQCSDYIPDAVMQQPCDELYKSVVAKNSLCPAGPNDADIVKLACRVPDGMYQVLSRAWTKKGCKPPPAPTLPPAPTGQVRSDNENTNAFTDWLYFWGEQAVKSNAVSAQFFPSYASILKIPAPADGASPEQYNTYVDNVVNIIVNWYAATDFSKKSNLKVLKMNVENSKPRFKGPAPTTPPPPTATSAPPPQPPPPKQPDAPPEPDPRLRNVVGFTDYKKALNNIFEQFKDMDTLEGFTVPATLRLSEIIFQMQAVAADNITAITNLLGGTANPNALAKIQTALSDNRDTMQKTAEKLNRNKAALNQQFNDDRGSQPLATKPRVMVLQDYILAAFTIAFAFFSIVVIFYVMKQTDYSGQSFLLMTVLMTVVAAIMYSWIFYIA